jgi:probable phosphoglycerate mutase
MIVVRHGATEWSVGGRHTGLTDVPLTEDGRAQARAVSRILRAEGLDPFRQVLTSPLRRAAETCALAGYDGAPDPDLVEWDYGAYEGLTSAEIRQGRPGWTLWDEGVPEGERCAEVGRRADRVIERVRGTDGDALCVAHGHVLRVVAARWLGLPPVAGRLLRLGTGTVSVLGWELDRPVIELWNRGSERP